MISAGCHHHGSVCQQSGMQDGLTWYVWGTGAIAKCAVERCVHTESCGNVAFGKGSCQSSSQLCSNTDAALQPRKWDTCTWPTVCSLQWSASSLSPPPRGPPECYYLEVFFFFFKILFIYFWEGERREKERERNINVWLLLVCPQLGTWPATQAWALTGNRSSDLLVHRPALSPLSHTSRGWRYSLYRGWKPLPWIWHNSIYFSTTKVLHRKTFWKNVCVCLCVCF